MTASETRTPVRRALLSVSAKEGIVELARALADRGVDLISTGGTAKALRDAGLAVRDVAEVTGHPEMMDGRVKTLHPRVHGGLLALRGDAAHERAMAEHGVEPIDLLVLNLYPFERTVAANADDATTIENIDIGGPAMLRSAAKNHAHVAVVVDPGDYGAVLEEVGRGGLDLAMRRRLAAKAFARVRDYDAAIDAWFASREAADWGEGSEAEGPLPATLFIAAPRVQTMRYGENPHQAAALYRWGEDGIAAARQVQGKELSYNNINDTDAALEAVAELGQDDPAVVIVKHANPCGVALGRTLAQAHGRALACDPVSAFGGIVAANRPLDRDAAEAITAIFTEVVVAPDADEGALDVFARKKNLRLLLTGALPDPARAGLSIRTVGGGLLVQGRDAGSPDGLDLRTVTKREPDAREMADLMLAWRVAKHVKSNAIVYVRDGMTVGVGAGQMSRLDSSRIAARKADDALAALKDGGRAAALDIETDRPLTAGSAVASDAFFPFADGLLAAAEAGASAIIQPGGSVRDEEVVAAADEAGLAMVLTGMRHFRH